MNNVQAVITGVGAYVPDYILTNEELSKMVDTNNDWIIERTGIKERRILKLENEGSSYLGHRAVTSLLQKTNTNPEEIELIICATATPDMSFPANANIISHKVGAINAAGFDISAACSGFIYALTMGANCIKSGLYKKVIVVGADKMSSIVDYTDRTTCILFGDGAGAVLLEPTTEDLGIKDTILKSDGSGEKFLQLPAGGSKRPTSLETVKDKAHYITQEGKIVFKFAVTKMADVSEEIMKRNHLTGDDIRFLVPHQANKRIIDATANRMGVSAEKVMLNIDRYGNTTCATIPLCLADYEHQLKKGDNLILAAFGGGFTWASAWVKWAYSIK